VLSHESFKRPTRLSFISQQNSASVGIVVETSAGWFEIIQLEEAPSLA